MLSSADDSVSVVIALLLSTKRIVKNLFSVNTYYISDAIAKYIVRFDQFLLDWPRIGNPAKFTNAITLIAFVSLVLGILYFKFANRRHHITTTQLYFFNHLQAYRTWLSTNLSKLEEQEASSSFKSDKIETHATLATLVQNMDKQYTLLHTTYMTRIILPIIAVILTDLLFKANGYMIVWFVVLATVSILILKKKTSEFIKHKITKNLEIDWEDNIRMMNADLYKND